MHGHSSGCSGPATSLSPAPTARTGDGAARAPGYPLRSPPLAVSRAPQRHAARAATVTETQPGLGNPVSVSFSPRTPPSASGPSAWLLLTSSGISGDGGLHGKSARKASRGGLGTHVPPLLLGARPSACIPTRASEAVRPPCR